jgi:hypothetical protein
MLGTHIEQGCIYPYGVPPFKGPYLGSRVEGAYHPYSEKDPAAQLAAEAARIVAAIINHIFPPQDQPTSVT